MTASEPWREVGDRVFVRRHRSLDLNCGLVVGEDACLVIDTRSHLGEAADLITAVRQVTRHPWTVVNTHAHWDHCFGNAAFRPAEIWGQTSMPAVLSATAERQRAAAMALANHNGRDDIGAQINAAPIDPPDRLVSQHASLPLGDRVVDLRFLGRGHTEGDLVVEADCGGDVSVLFAGDLVEEGNSPSFDDSYPLDWPGTLGRVQALARGPVVPGHGAVVDVDFVDYQRAELVSLERVIRLALAEQAAGYEPTGPVPPGSPYDEATTRLAVQRGWRQIRG